MRLWILFLSHSSSSVAEPMSLKVAATGKSASTHLLMLLCPLLCALVPAGGSTLSPEDSRSTAATLLPEDLTGTTIQLQPDLQTEAQTPTEAQTEAQTEALTDMQTQGVTSNYTGWSNALLLLLLFSLLQYFRGKWSFLLISKTFWGAWPSAKAESMERLKSHTE